MVEINRRTFGKAALGMSLTAFLAACTSGGTTTPGSSGAAGSKTLTIGLDALPSSFDPGLVSSGGTILLLWQAVFDTLLTYNTDGSIAPGAAESFEFNADSTVLTLKLRSGMKFSDGSAVNAAAAKASLEHMRDGTGSDASRLGGAVVTTTDDLTVVITMPAPTGLLPTFLTLAPGALASTASLKAADVATNPVGSGPYKLDPAATTSGATWTYLKNPDYWNAAAYPYDKLVFTVQTDITARVNALTSGQINAAQITSQTVDQLKSQGMKTIESDVNWAGLFLADRFGKTIPALGNVKVRQAINMVFDRPAIVTALFQGKGKVTNQIFNSGSTAYLPDIVDQYPYDVEGAKALMAEAGFADGFSVKIPSVTGLDYANPLIIQQLGLLKITATQVKIPDTQVIQELLSGKYPIMYFTLESRTALWDIVQALLPTAIWNLDKADDPKLTPLLMKAQTLTGDEAKQNAQAINKYIVDQAWFAPWCLPSNIWAMDKDTSATATLGSTAPYLYTWK